MRFFVGLHQPCSARHAQDVFISVHRLARRVRAFEVGDWIMDSGAFSTILKYRGYPDAPEAYAALIRRWAGNGNLLAAVSQDYMCEPMMLALTGLTVADHQRMTIERYDAIAAAGTAGVYLMPVLQGYDPAEYVEHLRAYGDRIPFGAWVGVGSVCKRNAQPSAVAAVLLAIKRERPDLRLHGFGVKVTALASGLVRQLLETADSMAWSFAARREGRDANSVGEAVAFADRIRRQAVQFDLEGRLYAH